MRKLKLTELNRPEPTDFRKTQKFPLVLVLDNIRSAMNIGSFFRTADGFAIEKIFLCGISACPPHKEISKTAIGADHTVEWEYYKDVAECVNHLIKQNYIIIGIEQTDVSIMLQDYMPEKNKKYALIFGNEVEGINDKIIDMLNTAIEIPQFGTKHSLNVSVAGGIAIWEFIRKIQDSFI